MESRVSPRGAPSICLLYTHGHGFDQKLLCHHTEPRVASCPTPVVDGLRESPRRTLVGSACANTPTFCAVDFGSFVNLRVVWPFLSFCPCPLVRSTVYRCSCSCLGVTACESFWLDYLRDGPSHDFPRFRRGKAVRRPDYQRFRIPNTSVVLRHTFSLIVSHICHHEALRHHPILPLPL